MKYTYNKSDKDTSGSTGIGAVGVLQIIFIVLKALNIIDWSWWQVFIPTFVSLGLTLLAILALVIIWTRDTM